MGAATTGALLSSPRSRWERWSGLRSWGQGGPRCSRELIPLTETAAAPTVQFPPRRWPGATGTGGHAMHIHPAGMGRPGGGFHLRSRRRQGQGQVLLHPHLPDGKTGAAQTPKQLVPVVLKGLQPGPSRRPHRQHPTPQAQGTAVRRQLGPDQLGPGQPETGQVPLLFPASLDLAETAAQGSRWRRRRRHQHRNIATALGLIGGSDRHATTLRASSRLGPP